MKDLVIGYHADGATTPSTVHKVIKAEQAGVDTAWLTRGPGAPDPLAIFAAAASSTSSIGFATCIVPSFPQHPLALAQSVIALDQFAPGRLRLGVGPSHEPLMRSMFGFDWNRPLEHLREFVTVLKMLFETGKVDFHGKRIDAVAQIAAPTNTQVMISALRRNAFLLAGEVADGGITWVTPRSHIEKVAHPAITEGAAKGTRPAPPVIAHTPVVVSEDRDGAIAAAMQQFSGYPGTPAYGAMLKEAGYEKEVAAGRTSEALMDALVISGNEEQVTEQIAKLPQSGIGEMLADIVLLPNDRPSRDRTLNLLGDLAKAK